MCYSGGQASIPGCNSGDQASVPGCLRSSMTTVAWQCWAGQVNDSYELLTHQLATPALKETDPTPAALISNKISDNVMLKLSPDLR